MFTGIIESMGEIVSVVQQNGNIRAELHCDFLSELQIDQSIAHDGVCLTVVELSESSYAVDVIHETLQKSNLNDWQPGKKVNLERSLSLENLLDGHIVQGHVDTVLECISIKDEDGSIRFTFSYPNEWATYLIPKGSVCINGVSLTIADLRENEFSVAVIPYTFQHTTFSDLSVNDRVNIEFDVVGKYMNRIAALKK